MWTSEQNTEEVPVYEYLSEKIEVQIQNSHRFWDSSTRAIFKLANEEKAFWYMFFVYFIVSSFIFTVF